MRAIEAAFRPLAAVKGTAAGPRRPGRQSAVSKNFVPAAAQVFGGEVNTDSRTSVQSLDHDGSCVRCRRAHDQALHEARKLLWEPLR